MIKKRNRWSETNNLDSATNISKGRRGFTHEIILDFNLNRIENDPLRTTVK